MFTDIEVFCKLLGGKPCFISEFGVVPKYLYWGQGTQVWLIQSLLCCKTYISHLGQQQGKNPQHSLDLQKQHLL